MKVYYHNFVVTLFEGFGRGIGQSFIHTLRNMHEFEKWLLQPVYKTDCASKMKNEYGIVNLESKDDFWDLQDFVWIEDNTPMYPIDSMMRNGIIHTWDNYPVKTRNRQIVTVHDTFWCAKKYRKYRIKNGPDEDAIRDRFRKYVDIVVCPSDFSKRDFLEFMDGGFSPNNVNVIPWGSKFEGWLDPQTYDTVPEHFLFVSVPEYRKNFPQVVFAYEMVQKRLKHNIPLVVVADMSILEPEMKERIAPLLLSDSIKFVGKVSDGELLQLYLKAYALLMPSKLEGYGMPIIEAASLGCPVVCSASSSMEEFEGVCKVNPDNEYELTKAIEMMLDKNIRDIFRNDGLRMAGRKTYKRAAKEYGELYKVMQI
jgi:glycosyltransferase involved in cell wall biosynthesis